jgi:hypothetical protein
VNLLRSFGHFLWDFVVGDDWVPAAGVVVVLGLTAVVVHGGGTNAWWLVPPAVVALLVVTVGRAIPRSELRRRR